MQRERLASKIGYRLSSYVKLSSCRDSSASSVYDHAVLLLLCSEHGHACARRWWTAYVRASSPSHVLQPRSARALPGQARPGQASASPGKRPRGWPNSQAAAVFPCLLPCIWAAAQCSPGRSPRGGSCCTPLHPHAQWHRHPPAPISRAQLCTDSLAQPALITH